MLTYVNSTGLQIYNEAAASLGTMENDGNFVLRDNSSRILWRSFDWPTNTLLPGQVLVQSQKLYSNAKEVQIQITQPGISCWKCKLMETWCSPPIIFTTQTFAANVSLVSNNSSSLYLVSGTKDEIYSITKNMSSPVEDYYHRVTVEDLGNFQQ